jgi:predicted acylesterase/phospholipase RssA/MinD-like ATPase involved in chromosome partitioning or flagellar assembly
MSDGVEPLSSRHGEVITFYSYKGGTGRSMALANTACLLAGEGSAGWTGKRVLMVDWDLEAPGLHRYFREALALAHGNVERRYVDEELNAKKGLMDLLVSIQDKVYTSTPEGTIQDQDAADRLLTDIDISDFILHTDNSNLDLMKAGAQDDAYGQRVALFQWESLFERSPWLFREFALRLARDYDYVLIDSRTGETDTSGICTRMLPQKLVVVFTPNRQSLTGVDALVRKAIAYRRKSEDPRPLAVFPLPSRVDSTFPTFVQNWRDGSADLDLQGYRWHFEALLKELYSLANCDLGEYFRDVELQYIPEYSFGEEVAVRREKGGGSRLSFAKSYETFARWLIERSGPWEHTGILRERERQAEARRARRTSADEQFGQLTAEEQLLARRVLSRLVRLSHGDQSLARAPVNTRDLDARAASVLDRLESVGLVTVDPPDDRGMQQVRLADDTALQWSRLLEWVSADRAFLLWRQELDDARARWEARGRPVDLLWAGPHARKASSWRTQRALDLNAAELEFLSASEARKGSDEIVLTSAERRARAQALLRGVDTDIAEIESLARTLKNGQEFGYARRLFALARRHPGYKSLDEKRRRWFGQQHALCTYKDPDLSAERFLRAYEILREVDDPGTSTDQETLGLAGAIFKRLWQVEGQRQSLEQSLLFYRRGHARGATKDQGYNGGNAAFLLDVLAREEASEARKAGSESATATTRRDEARRIREELIRTLPPLLDEPQYGWLRDQWWFYATLAEAHFGLGQYEDAMRRLREGPPQADVPPWEFQSTIQQLGDLVQLHADFQELMPKYALKLPLDPDRARGALREFLGPFAPAVERVVAGKLGLALSGGGFRASLFHIGVLACLAERDVLRHIEVLSCVSGGSIIGAHYYLEVQRLLTRKADAEITQQDYIDTVQRLIDKFLAGVQTNVRSQVLAELWTNLKAMFWPAYTRTQRLGELYEQCLFARVDDGKGAKPRYMDDLKFTPSGENADSFQPKYDNWRRRNKVPTLVLNATTLNTGHNWQFTATWMGEPPSAIDADVDGNYRLRRMYYVDAPHGFQRIRLGHAVAASSCVPGLFEPLVLQRLYPAKTVRLVDGGVFDNQGVASLLEQDCGVMLVSDASGQMAALDEPGAGMLSVPLRSFSVSMARVRQAEYHELEARRRSSLLRGLMFLHLKKDLDVDPVDWVDCQDPSDASEEARPIDRRGILTRFGIRKDVQGLLASIRTDLDSFTELEAYALMTSGYRMAQFDFRRSLAGSFPVSERVNLAWKFLEVEPLLSQGPQFEAVKRHLRVAASGAFKVWRLSRPLSVIGSVLIATLVGVLLWAWRYWAAVPVVTIGDVGGAVLAALATMAVGSTLVRLVRFRKTLGQIGLVTSATLLASIGFKIHLAWFDRWFLRLGRIERFKQPGGTT